MVAASQPEENRKDEEPGEHEIQGFPQKQYAGSTWVPQEQITSWKFFGTFCEIGLQQTLERVRGESKIEEILGKHENAVIAELQHVAA